MRNGHDAMSEAVAAHQRGDLRTAETRYREILAAAPGRAEALQYLGVLLAQTGRAAAGIEFMQRAVLAAPRDLEACFNLAHALAGAGRTADAIGELRRGVAVDAGFLPGWTQLGALLYGAGRLTEAAAAFAQAAALAPHDAAAHYNLARAQHADGKLDAAAAGYRRAVALDPLHADALNNLGTILTERGEPAAAVDAFRQALAARPGTAGIRINLGNALRQARRFDAALAEFTAVLSAEPDNRAALHGAGTTLFERGEPARGAVYLEKLLDREPAHAGALMTLGLWHFSELRFADARALLARALAADPLSPEANVHHATALFQTRGEVETVLAQYRRALALRPDFALARSSLLMALHYDPRPDAAEIRRAHDEFETVHAAPLRALQRPHGNVRAPQRRLRIGYVSPDFRRHSCAYFVEPLLAAHDPASVEIYAYANVARPDATTARLQGLCAHWRDIQGLSDAAAADLVRADGIDIPVDLAGHTAGNRLLLFAHKPAPVQVTWLGYPDTTGLAAIDYRLTDPIADPIGAAEPTASETLVRLEPGFLCYAAPADAPPVSALPALAEGPITFGSFNNLAKINDAVVACWAAVLRAVPGARLAIKDNRLRDRDLGAALVARFTAHGVAPEAVVFLPPLAAPREFLALYNGIDIALDPFPYNGTATTCEALWMGVPVVTCPGERHSSRVGASLLQQIGREAWIARDRSDYAAIAARLAADLEQLAGERAALRSRVARSTLCDGPHFARQVEAAFRTMWRRWCETPDPVAAPAPAGAASRPT